LTEWIVNRVKGQGGSITQSAAEKLAAFVGNDLGLLAQEIDKLLAYVGDGRRIEEADVKLLVSQVREAIVFDFVDALGSRDGRQAVAILHRLLDDGAPPPYLLTMIARQFRILLQIKDLESRELASGTIRERLGLHPFVFEKGVGQARRFTLEQLERAYELILEADAAMKTGRMEPVLTLDLLTVRLCG
jgi:DNA polymerase-3 subunit delta